ncbi:prolipoprotein diacylglyceryl transferase family protein [Sphingomonas qilianensis]|uniref:Prolipoprotein diacylglyceryl transferase family protein n=1 Tax=Sphingomonas qilianensis TaxID=1736690 RepID=A0ABU9XST1_9SPHN
MGSIVTLGPLAMATDRLLGLVAVMAFIGLAALLTRAASRPTSNAVTIAVLAGLGTGRIGYVAAHLPSFREDPAAVFAIWQGGFSPIAGIAGAAAALIVMLGRSTALYRSLASLGVAVLLWVAATQLMVDDKATPLPRGLVAYTIDGAPIAIDTLRGKPFVINLWATWCGPCQREMPMLVRAAAARPAVPILFIDQGETPDTVTAFLTAKGLASPSVLIDRSQDFGRVAGSRALPTTLFVARDGMIRAHHAGEISRAALDDGIDDLEKRP